MSFRHVSVAVRLIITLTVIVSAATLAPSGGSAGAGAGGVTFGAYAQPRPGQSNIDAVRQLEQRLGRTLPMVRAFGNWDDSLGADKPFHRWVRDGGRQLMASVKPKRDDGSPIPWREIGAAQPGSALHADMVRLADGARRFDEPMIVTFHHEPEAGPNRVYGTSEDFTAAFRRFVEVFRASGASNVRFAWVMTSWSFEVGEIVPDDRRRASAWYPGDDVVDFIGADPYNWNNCRGAREPWTPLERTIEPFLRFGRQHPDKPLLIAEWGSDEGAIGQKAQWLDDARAMFRSGEHRERIAAILYFHDDGLEEGWPDCDWWLDSSPETLAAARRFVDDDFFRTPVPLAAPVPPPAPTTTTTTTTPPRPDTLPPDPPPVPAAPEPEMPRCFGYAATIVGTPGDDDLRGTSGRDVIVGLGGDDRITGGAGDDVICGGAGRDVVWGEAGRDRIAGGQHRDRLHGGSGNDRVWGDSGRDIISGGDGRDTLIGGAGPDRLLGGRQADRLVGEGGSDHLRGGNGADTLIGGRRTDLLDGGFGVDTCRAGSEGDAGSVNCE